MEIPYQELSRDALRGLIEQFVLQEGTNYGDREYGLDQKVAQVERQLQEGHAAIVFDAETETCFIQPRRRRL